MNGAVRRELWLLRREIERQDGRALLHLDGCACWACIGKLQAEVIRHQLEMRGRKDDDLAARE